MSLPRELLRLLALSGCLLMLVLPPAGTQPPPAESAAQTDDDSLVKQTLDFAADYKSFIAKAPTEVTFVEESIRLAEDRGFHELAEKESLRPGAKLYVNNRDRSLILFVVGREAFHEGFRIVSAHIDSPRLDLKARPLRRAGNFVQLQTMPHGGIKSYQWVNIPLALVGRVYKKDGAVVSLSVGLKPGEPVFVIPDLAPHVDESQRRRTSRQVVNPEEMDPVIYSRVTKSKANVLENARKHLKEAYGIDEDDLVSAELSFVPALAPADVGFDGTLIAAYGQDDRACAYPALRALLENGSPRFTTMLYLVDNEETGSNNNTGAQSSALNDLLADLIYRQEGKGYRDVMARQALRKTLVISADVNPAVHPIWGGSLERQNAPQLGKGINFKIYGHGSSPNAELTARLRGIFDAEEIPWQVMTYRAGSRGGMTIGQFLADDNMDVVDMGIPILSAHSPYEISSKTDLYAFYRAMRAFYEKVH